MFNYLLLILLKIRGKFPELALNEETSLILTLYVTLVSTEHIPVVE